jgi:hypothetical protein
MKKLNLLYAVLFAVIIVACKDDDEAPTFKKEDFQGSWERTSTTIDDDGACDTSGETLEFRASDFTSITVCDDASTEVDLDYTYDNKSTISFEFVFGAKYVIKTLNATTLTIDIFYEDHKAGTSTYKKI